MTNETHNGPVIDRTVDKSGSAERNFEVIECEPCGFKHVHPLPTQDELAALYDEDYYAREKPLYIERYREDLDWWNLVYAERFDTLEARCDGARRILDVGSGPGYFLALGKERGWETLGIEPSSQAAAHGRELGLEIVEDYLSDATCAQLGTFDAVHMCNVLEHVPDPVALLRLARRLLKPSGHLLVIVPNDYNPFQAALRADGHAPWWVAPPHHLNYFSPDSLGHVLKRAGFGTVEREGTFPMELFLLMGENYVGDDALGRDCHAKRKRLEKTLAQAGLGPLKRKLYQALASLNLGREIQILAQKAES